jgi:hypothetical protein
MKTVLIIHDIDYTDINNMMSGIDYIARTSKTFDGDFQIMIEQGSPLEPVLKDAGLPFIIAMVMPDEPDTVIAFTYSDDELSSPARDIVMAQWQSRRPVYPFQLVKQGK